jgi:hypothetical protein
MTKIERRKNGEELDSIMIRYNISWILG